MTRSRSLMWFFPSGSLLDDGTLLLRGSLDIFGAFLLPGLLAQSMWCLLNNGALFPTGSLQSFDAVVPAGSLQPHGALTV